MAIATLFPRKAAPTKTRVQSMSERHDYDSNPEKTRGGNLVSSFMCQPESAAKEFETSKLIYEAITGKGQPKNRDVTMYRIIQSFKPGETTAEEANRIGYELAMEFTKGQHQFVVYTHEDRAHIHNHIEFNSTNLDCNGKFKNIKDSVKVLRTINDKICLAHGLSIPDPKRKKSHSCEEMGALRYGTSFKEMLRRTIDAAIEKVLAKGGDFDDFLACMREAGYEVRHRGRSLEFRAPEQLRFTRSFRLGDEYTEEALQERVAGIYKRNENVVRKQQTADKKVNLLVDIQAILLAGKGKGYERWAKVFNLKEASRTLNFLTENGITDYDALLERTEEIGKRFDALAARIKQLEGRMAEIAQLKMQIINYSKTREIYKEYKKSRQKEAFRAAHADEIEKHEAAKAAFDALKGKPIPRVAQLSEEYAALLAEKRQCYEEYRRVRQEMVDYENAKHNVEQILGITGQVSETQKDVEH